MRLIRWTRANDQSEIGIKALLYDHIGDDFTFLKIVSLVNTVISSHNTNQQVVNDLQTHGQIVEGSHLKSQDYLDKINLWSKTQEMINETKKNNVSKPYR